VFSAPDSFIRQVYMSGTWMFNYGTDKILPIVELDAGVETDDNSTNALIYGTVTELQKRDLNNNWTYNWISSGWPNAITYDSPVWAGWISGLTNQAICVEEHESLC
jgi:hypothetical protein